MGHYCHMAIFTTRLIKDAPKTMYINDNVVVEIFNEFREYTVPIMLQSRVIPNDESVQARVERIPLMLQRVNEENFKYIVITSICKFPEGQNIDVYNIPINAETEISKVITLLSLNYSPQLFAERIYYGPVIYGYLIMNSIYVPIADNFTIQEEDIKSKHSNINDYLLLDSDHKNRFAIMSRLYSTSMLGNIDAGHFLNYWAIFEIYPMKNTSDIQPLVNLLGKITNLNPSFVKEKLGIGRLYGKRCDIIHNGIFETANLEERGILFAKLDCIACTILREMLGLPYDGRLNTYLIENVESKKVNVPGINLTIDNYNQFYKFNSEKDS